MSTSNPIPISLGCGCVRLILTILIRGGYQLAKRKTLRSGILDPMLTLRLAQLEASNCRHRARQTKSETPSSLIRHRRSNAPLANLVT